MEPRVIRLVRLGLLGTLLFFSLIVLGLAAHLLSGFQGTDVIVPDYLGLDLAMAIITLVVVVPSIVIDFFRKGAFTSMVVVELAWSFVLTVLWIAASGDTTASRVGAVCDFVETDFDGDIIGNDGPANGVCHEAQALIAFSWLNFLILLSWLVTLVSFAITAHTRGNTSVWTGPVNGTDFFAVKGYQGGMQPAYGTPQPQYMQKQQMYTGTPVQQHQNTPPMGYPPTGYNATPSPGGVQV